MPSAYQLQYCRTMQPPMPSCSLPPSGADYPDFHHLLSSIGVEDQPTGFCFSCLLPRSPLSFREVPSSSATFLSNSFSGLLSGSWQEGRNGWANENTQSQGHFLTLNCSSSYETSSSRALSENTIWKQIGQPGPLLLMGF